MAGQTDRFGNTNVKECHFGPTSPRGFNPVASELRLAKLSSTMDPNTVKAPRGSYYPGRRDLPHRDGWRNWELWGNEPGRLATSTFNVSLSPCCYSRHGTRRHYGQWIGAMSVDPWDRVGLQYGTGRTLYATSSSPNVDHGGVIPWKVALSESGDGRAGSHQARPPEHIYSASWRYGAFRHGQFQTYRRRKANFTPLSSLLSQHRLSRQKQSHADRSGGISELWPNLCGGYSKDQAHVDYLHRRARLHQRPGSIAISADDRILSGRRVPGHGVFNDGGPNLGRRLPEFPSSTGGRFRSLNPNNLHV